MVDECQDMNKAERELILKCRKENTRLVSVGDSNQMLYSFAGGDPDSFKELKSIPNTKCLPLSISYRCPKNVVDFAKKLVPSIEANEANTIEGKILYDVSLNDVEDGDMSALQVGAEEGVLVAVVAALLVEADGQEEVALHEEIEG